MLAAAAGLIGGKGFAVDATLIVADANKCPSTPGDDWSTTSIRRWRGVPCTTIRHV
jgi:hypothetical protein